MTGIGRTLALSRGADLSEPEVTDLAAVLVAAAAGGTGGIRHVRDERDEVDQTYGELAGAASAILGGMRERGAARGDKVIVQVADEPELLAVFWACVLGGMVPLPLGTGGPSPAGLDRLWRPGDRVWIVDDGETPRTEPSRARRLGSAAGLAAGPSTEDYTPGDWDDLAVLLLTSGSTGTPKAVMLTHGNILSRTVATARVNGLDSGLRSFNWMPLDHVGGLVMFHVRDVYLRCTQVHARIQWILDDPLRWIDQMHRHASTATWAPNFAFGLVNDNAHRMDGREWDLGGLDYIMNGGEAVKPVVLQRFLRLLAPFGLPSHAICPGWGMSETSSGIVDRRFRPETGPIGRFIAVGRPHPGVGLRVVDQDDRVLPEGETGLLQASGAPVFGGYYNNAEVNRRTFTADGWFRTGDLAYIEGGELTVTGRGGDTVTVGDTTLHGHEIESTVEGLDAVEPSFTVACAVAPPGAEGPALAVFCHPRGGASTAALAEAIREAVRAAHGAEVAYVVPVSKDDIPKTGIGKLRRAALSRRFAAAEFGPPASHGEAIATRSGDR
ncbi:AMP-binding protein [Glycomyces arizonensis]|uniref:AMP-binding protein n=1 Tax=Glycomyces arizonensis TaxID=256035 RepID=UPI0004268FA2|nr:AMP-binding protein [Glycomyces arizonensis]